jgi:glycosyltransferase involved in cell wall biosynthesis
MSQPLISVLMATRDRPELFGEALDSVLSQTHPNLEVVVVDDGSSAENLSRYQTSLDRAAARLGERFTFQSLLHRPKGHGQSYSLNVAASRSTGDYLCFLDDDDKWTDTGHLTRLAATITGAAEQGQAVDLYMANQDAWTHDQRRVGTLWLGTLAAELTTKNRQPDQRGNYTVTVTDLMDSTGFCHLNCLTVRRALYEQVGGMDEGIRWECDRDLFLKLIDRAGLMVFHPAVMSYHRVPDPGKGANMTTTLGMLEKRLLQSLVLDRALIRARHPAIRQHARQHKVYAIERMAAEFATLSDWAAARYYAAQALGARPSLGRALLLLRCWMRRPAARQ